MPEPLDNHGREVSSFISRATNLTRTAELVDVISEMAASDAWRDYTTALGRQQWRESEFDYFLIACGLPFADVSRVIAWSRKGGQLAPMMDTQANAERRRTLAEASAAYRSPGTSLVEEAQRLGWARAPGHGASLPMGTLKSAIPKQSRARARRAARPEPLPAKRRRELDRLSDEILAGLANNDERRYLIARLSRKQGRPS